MSNSNLKPTVTLAVRTNKGDQQEVRLRFRVRAGRDYQFYYRSDIICTVGNMKRFNPDCTVKGRTILPPAQLQQDIDEVVSRLKRAAFVAVERGIKTSEGFTALMLDKTVTGEKTTLLQDFADYIHERCTDDPARRITESTAWGYNGALKHLQSFLDERDLIEVSTPDFTPQMLIDFAKYLGRQVSQNSRSAYLLKLRLFFSDMESRDLIAVTPFNKRKDEIRALTTREKPDEPFALTADELKQIAASDVPAHLQDTKVIFLMQAYIGCRYKDLANITKSDIKTDEGGFRYVSYIPQKTAKSRFCVTTPLLPSVEELLSEGVTFPLKLSVIKVHNERVKALLRHCGITRNVEVWDSSAQRYVDTPLWCAASSKICRRTAETLLARYQVNMFTTGLHQVGSDAIKAYVDMSLLDRYRLMCAAYGEKPAIE